MPSPDEVIIINAGNCLRIRLNRPQVIHALNLNMVQIIIAALQSAKADENCNCVIIDHFSGRGFCAGGDIAMLRESGAKDSLEARAFFFAEYQMNHLIHSFPKPIISFLDGVTMGGGVGLSVHGKYRIATPNTLFAMPETGIGLFPDVGGSWFLPRLKGQIGIWLALTGARLKAGDCIEAGIATQYVSAENIENLKIDLIAHYNGALEVVPNRHCETAPAPIQLNDETQTRIARHFAFDSVEEIFSSLENSDCEWAAGQLEILRTKSPQTLKIALNQLRIGERLHDFSEAMKMEYRIGSRVVSLNDFQEGVRALIIEKDNNPHWKPDNIYEIDPSLINAIFAPLPASEEWHAI